MVSDFWIRGSGKLVGGLNVSGILTHFALSFGPYETLMTCLGIVAAVLLAMRTHNTRLERAEKKRSKQLAEAKRKEERMMVEACVKTVLGRMTPNTDFFLRAARRAPNKSAVRPS